MIVAQVVCGSFSVQVSSRFWCGEQVSLFHSSSNVTPISCSSASVNRRISGEGNV